MGPGHGTCQLVVHLFQDHDEPWGRADDDVSLARWLVPPPLRGRVCTLWR